MRTENHCYVQWIKVKHFEMKFFILNSLLEIFYRWVSVTTLFTSPWLYFIFLVKSSRYTSRFSFSCNPRQWPIWGHFNFYFRIVLDLFVLNNWYLFFKIAVLLFNIELISAVQQTESAVHLCISTLPWLSFPFRSPHWEEFYFLHWVEFCALYNRFSLGLYIGYVVLSRSVMSNSLWAHEL